MWILLPGRRAKINTPEDVNWWAVVRVLQFSVERTRFTATFNVETLPRSKRLGIKVTNIRLRNKKDYCGAHPGPCVVERKKHPVCRYLEGLDWVGFAWWINNVLDAIPPGLFSDVDVWSYNREKIGSRPYYLRQKGLRRLGFPHDILSRGGREFAHWVDGDPDDFEDYRGKPAPPLDLARVDDGTPGFMCYTVEDEARLRADQDEWEAEHAEELAEAR
jgi:hypothetical protein